MNTSSLVGPVRADPAGRPLLVHVAAPETRWAAAALALFLLGGLAQLAGLAEAWWWTPYVLCCVVGGWAPARDGVRALRDRTLDVDLLMILAAAGAVAVGQVLDGALLVVIFATSGALEAYGTRRTRDSVRTLLRLAPDRAVRVRHDGTEEEVAADDLVVGDHVVVRPGERVSADGDVVDGLSEVDQSSITGEPLPVVRGPGDQVYAGSLNGVGAVTVRVTRAAHDSVASRVVEMVQRASATRATRQLLVERVEQRYSVGVVAVTTGLLLVPLLLGDELQPSLLRAMTFMIVASPCAVVLATMPPLLATIANAGRHGVLVKSSVALEQLGAVSVVAFDKTGTLTHGVPRVAAVEATADWSEEQVLAVAAAAERGSEHPVGRAVVRAARERDLRIEPADAFEAAPGRGVAALVGGRQVAVGSPSTSSPPPGPVGELVGRHEAGGRTVVLVRVDGQTVGVLALTDRVRDGARPAVRALGELTGRAPLLLTGDNAAAAHRVAEAVGIDRVESGLLPEDKVRLVEQLRAAGKRVLLVGDGINDAPAMAAARVGAAMGTGGSDLALQTSEVVLVQDALADLARAVGLARRARRVVVANLVLAGAVITTLVAWDVLGTLPLPLGVAGHEGSTVVVALNGLRLLRPGAWDAAARTAHDG